MDNIEFLSSPALWRLRFSSSNNSCSFRSLLPVARQHASSLLADVERDTVIIIKTMVVQIHSWKNYFPVGRYTPDPVRRKLFVMWSLRKALAFFYVKDDLLFCEVGREISPCISSKVRIFIFL